MKLKILPKYIYLLIQISSSFLLLTLLKTNIKNINILKEILIFVTTISTFQIAWQSLVNNKIPHEIINGKSIINIFKSYAFSLLIIVGLLIIFFSKILKFVGASKIIGEKLIEIKILLSIAIIVTAINFIYYSINISLKKQTNTIKNVSISNMALMLLIYFTEQNITIILFLKFYIFSQVFSLIINSIQLILFNKLLNKENKESINNDKTLNSIVNVISFLFILASRFSPLFLSYYILKITSNSLIEYHYLLLFINIFLSIGVNPILNFTYAWQTAIWNKNIKKRIILFYETLIELNFIILFFTSIALIFILKLAHINTSTNVVAISSLTIFHISVSAIISKLFYLKNFIIVPTVIDFIATLILILLLTNLNLKISNINLLAIQNFLLVIITLFTTSLFDDLKKFMINSTMFILFGSLFFLIFSNLDPLEFWLIPVIIIIVITIFKLLKIKKNILGMKLFLLLHE